MPSPVTSEDFQNPNFAGSVCDQLNQLLSMQSRLKEWFAWAFDVEGNATQNFKNLFLSIGLPVGGIIWMPVDTVPDGFLLANGGTASRTQRAALFAVYGTTFGIGDGTTTFNLPALQGKFLVGAGGSHPVGDQGGSENVTLTTPQLPAHRHGPGIGTNFVNVTEVGGAQNWTGGPYKIEFAAETAEAGGGQSHTNMPPYRAGLWLCKY